MKQVITITLEIDEKKQKEYAEMEGTKGYDSLRSFFEDINYKVVSITGRAKGFLIHN